MSRITLLMDLPPADTSHATTIAGLEHARAYLNADVDWRLTKTDAIGELDDAVLVGPGSPYLDPRAAEAAITRARRRLLPLVAI